MISPVEGSGTDVPGVNGRVVVVGAGVPVPFDGFTVGGITADGIAVDGMRVGGPIGTTEAAPGIEGALL